MAYRRPTLTAIKERMTFLAIACDRNLQLYMTEENESTKVDYYNAFKLAHAQFTELKSLIGADEDRFEDWLPKDWKFENLTR